MFDRLTGKCAYKLNEIAPERGKRVKDWFVVSKPYLDLGGAGLVVTIARGILIDDLPQAALCIDLKLHTQLQLPDLLRERVDSFGGYRMTVTCEIPGGSNCSIKPGIPGDRTSPEDPLLRSMEKALKGHAQDIPGNIAVLNAAEETSRIEASLPLRRVGRTEDFLLISIDLLQFRRQTTIIGAAALVALGMVASIFLYFWLTQVKYSRNYREAFQRLAVVMNESRTPYLRLDSNDLMIDINNAFLSMLGYSETDRASLNERRFGSLLADGPSIDTYKLIEDKRRQRVEDVAPYYIKLKRKDESVVNVRIVSAAVPDSKGGTLPETFGILLQSDEPNVVQMEFRTGLPGEPKGNQTDRNRIP